MEASTVNTQAPEGENLRKTTLGVSDIVFFIVAASAPLTVVAGGVASTYLITGNAGVPLLFLVLGAVLALFVTGYAAMSHHITNAGAFYAYVSKGISKVLGVGTSFLALIAYNSMQIGILGLFGFVFAGFMATHTSLDWQWYTWVFVAIAIIGILGWLRVDLNAKVLAVFLTAEILVVLFFDLVVAGNPAPQGIVADQWNPDIAFGTGVGAALCFTMAAFVGFESAAIYGEECKEPRRTVAKATYIALAITSIFYALSAWMLASAVGSDTVISAEKLVAGGFTTPDGAAPDPTSIVFITLSVETSTTIADIATLLFCTSLFAASLSFHNAVSRYFFALGRARVLPGVFARTNRQGAPFIGSLTQTLIAAVVIFIFWQSDNDPALQLFPWLTNLGALGVIALLALASFAVVGYFSRHPHDETPWTSRYAPAIAGVALTFIFFLVLGNFNTLITGSPDAPGDDRSVILPAILIGGTFIGILVGFWIKATKPDVYARIGEMGEEDGRPG